MQAQRATSACEIAARYERGIGVDLQQPEERVVRWIDGLDPNDAYLSALTVGEIRKGVEKLPDSRRKETIHRWLSEDLPLRFEARIVNLDANAALTWGEC